VKYRNAGIIFPIQEYIVGRLARCGQPMSGVAADPTSHQESVGTTASCVGFAIVTVMTVRYPDRNSFETRPSKQHTGKPMNVAMNHIVSAFPQDFSKASAKLPKVLGSRAAKHPGS
jgi:hypothetical protein